MLSPAPLTRWLGYVPGSAVLSLACHTVHTVPPTALAKAEPPAEVWITQTDGTRLLFSSPRVSGDTLSGLMNGEPASIVLSPQTKLEVRSADPVRTAAVAVIAGGVAFGALYYLQHRPDVNGNAMTCYGFKPQDEILIPCCLTQVGAPC